MLWLKNERSSLFALSEFIIADVFSKCRSIFSPWGCYRNVVQPSLLQHEQKQQLRQKDVCLFKDTLIRMFLTVCFLLLKQSEVSNRQAQTYWFRGSNIKQEEEKKKKLTFVRAIPCNCDAINTIFYFFWDEYVSGWFWVACVEDPWTVWVLRRCKMTVLQEQCHATIEGTKTDHYFRKLFFQHHEIFKKFVGWTIWLVWIWRKLSVQFVAAAMFYILNGIWRLTEYVWRDLLF